MTAAIIRLDGASKDWVQIRTQHPWVEDSCGVVAWRDKKPIGAVVFDSITSHACNVHMCIDTPLALRSGLIPIGFDFAFRHLGLRLMIAGIPSTNLKMVDLAAHIGFTALGEIPNAVSPGIDRVIMTMERDACSWLIEEAA